MNNQSIQSDKSDNLQFKRVSLPQIAQALKERDNFVICGHVNPDADCVSTQAALTLCLKTLGKTVVNLLADRSAVENGLDFLPVVDEFVPARNFNADNTFDGKPYTFVSVDVPLKRRTGRFAPAIKDSACFTITIDHHEPEDLDSNIVFTDTEAASASLLIWELTDYLGVDITSDIANCCLCGLVSDTGSFRYQNADKRCFDAAAAMVDAGADPAEISKNLFQRRSLNSILLEAKVIEHLFINEELRFAVSYLSSDDFATYNATKDDSDVMVDLLRSLDSVDVVCMLRQEHPQQDVHGSLRSKTDVDVSAIARQYVGGGHKAAAGFTVRGCYDLQEALSDIKKKITYSIEMFNAQ